MYNKCGNMHGATLKVMKILSVGAEFFHADGRTDRLSTIRRTDLRKLKVAFRNFAKASQNYLIILVLVLISLKISLQ